MATKTLNKLLLAESSAYTGAAKNNKSRRLKGLTNIPHPNPIRFSTGVFPVNEPRNCVKGFWNGVKANHCTSNRILQSLYSPRCAGDSPGDKSRYYSW